MRQSVVLPDTEISSEDSRNDQRFLDKLDGERQELIKAQQQVLHDAWLEALGRTKTLRERIDLTAQYTEALLGKKL